MDKQQFSRKTMLKIIAGFGMVAAISGCSSSGGSGSSSSTAAVATDAATSGPAAAAAPTSVFAATAEDILSKSADENTTLSANGVTLIRSKVPVTRGTTPITLKIVDDSVEVSALGVSQSFTKADKRLVGDDDQVIYENDNGWVSIDGRSGEDINNGNTVYNYMTPLRGGFETVEDGSFDRFYAVVGLETPHDVIAKKANATYSGSFSLDSYPVEDPKTQFQDHGNVGLTANFEEGKINGDLTFSPGSDDELKVGLKEANISGNSFATTFSHETDTEKATGDFAGKFYGNEAQEAGGTISYDYHDGSSDVAAGTWVATEDVSD